MGNKPSRKQNNKNVTKCAKQNPEESEGEQTA